MRSSPARYEFDIRLHRRPATAVTSGSLSSGSALLATLQVPTGQQAEPMAVSFERALDEIASLPGCYGEPDGSILWTGQDEAGRWQVDGNLFDRGGQVVFATLSGSCPPVEFDRLLACFGWPEEPLMMELVRAAVFVSEADFRQQAGRPSS